MALPELTVHWKDLTPYLNQSQGPQFYIERPLKHGSDKKGGVFNHSEVARTGEFWTPQNSVISQDLKWAVCKLGDHVRIPIFAYETMMRTESCVLASGLQIALAAVLDCIKVSGQVPIATHLLLGHQCTDLAPQGQDAYRCYVGICFQTKP